MVQHATVAIRKNFPFQHQIEVFKVFGRHDVVTATRAEATCTSADSDQRVVDHLPARGHSIFLVATPAFGGLAIKEQPPASLLFCVRERIGKWGGIGGIEADNGR